jgi:hypothetical protein
MILRNLSFPKSKKVRGVTVRRLKLGRFVECLELLADLPADLLGACFPGRTLDAALLALTQADAELLRTLLRTVIQTVPEKLVLLLSELLDVPARTLLDSEEIGPVGLAELCEAFVEVNELGSFFAPARNIRRMFRAAGGGGHSS